MPCQDVFQFDTGDFWIIELTQSMLAGIEAMLICMPLTIVIIYYLLFRLKLNNSWCDHERLLV